MGTQESPKYRIGDMLWAKVGSHPWWPCMVYYAPEDEGYVRSKGTFYSYHVQFFGPMVERAWVNDSKLLQYEGKALFDDFIEDIAKNGTKPKKDLYNLKMRTSIISVWEESWQEAEQALPLTPDQRVIQYGRVYVEAKKKWKPHADDSYKVDESVTETEEDEVAEKPSTSSKKRKRSSVVKTPVADGEDLTLEEEEEALSNFMEEEKAIVLSDAPDLSIDIIEDGLRDRWHRMTSGAKRRYLEMDTHTTVQRESKVSGRRIKPTVRNLDQHVSSPVKQGTKRKVSTPVADSVKATSSPVAKKAKQQPSSPVKYKPHKDSGEGVVHIPDDEVNFEIQRLVSSPGEYRLQNVCPICEVHSPDRVSMTQCTGGCFRWYHPICTNFNIQEKLSNFKCPECRTGKRICSICAIGEDKELGKTTICQTSQCGRAFHLSCVKSYSYAVVEGKNVIECPAHSCITCSVEEPGCKSAKTGTLIHCIRCPKAFHSGDLCMAAGAIERSLSQVVCPSHFQQTQVATNKPVHINFCYKCKKSTPKNMLECDDCPAKFHPSCQGLDESEDPPILVRCTECENKLPIRYAQLVWVKILGFRWWPAEVIHPRNAPINILNIPHPDGSFPVHFIGVDEYQWVSRRRVISFQFGQDTSLVTLGGNTSKLEKMFNKSMSVVPTAYQLYVAYVSRRVPLHSMVAEKLKDDELMPKLVLRTTKKTVSFKFIKESVPMGENVQISSFDAATWPVCCCSTSVASPCSTSTCSNRAAHIECHPSLCPAGTKCANQMFVSRKYPVQGVSETKNRGHCIKALTRIPMGTFVNEYVGEMIDKSEVPERLKAARKLEQEDLYLFRLDDRRVIDAGPRGNLSRYINHSCEPNLEVQIWRVNGDIRAGLFATTDIEEGEELTFNYGNLMVHDRKIMCLCGTDSCTGYLNTTPIASSTASHTKPPKIPASSVSPALTKPPLLPATNHKTVTVSPKETPTKEGKKKKRKSEMNGVPLTVKTKPVSASHTRVSLSPASDSQHENLCYRCGDGGELVLCDEDGCSKSYHLNCLGLTKPPIGIWHCPWHHCDDCGRLSTVFCHLCPNSFCKDHQNDARIEEDPTSGETVCPDHLPFLQSSAPSNLTQSPPRVTREDSAQLKIISVSGSNEQGDYEVNIIDENSNPPMDQGEASDEVTVSVSKSSVTKHSVDTSSVVTEEASALKHEVSSGNIVSNGNTEKAIERMDMDATENERPNAVDESANLTDYF